MLVYPDIAGQFGTAGLKIILETSKRLGQKESPLTG
jgi:hypothetical protein